MQSGALSKIFSWNTFHWAHTAMWVGMGAMALATSGATLTLPNAAAALADSGWQMLSGLTEIFNLDVDLLSTDLTYEWGSAAHGGGHEMAGAIDHSAHGVQGDPVGVQPA